MLNQYSTTTVRRLVGAALIASLGTGLSGGALSHGQVRAASSGISGDVVFWNAYNTVSPENTTLITKVIPAFQKLYPNVTVYSQNIPYNSLLTKLVASV